MQCFRRIARLPPRHHAQEVDIAADEAVAAPSSPRAAHRSPSPASNVSQCKTPAGLSMLTPFA